MHGLLSIPDILSCKALDTRAILLKFEKINRNDSESRNMVAGTTIILQPLFINYFAFLSIATGTNHWILLLSKTHIIRSDFPQYAPHIIVSVENDHASNAIGE
jgi:hypothetical protein